MASRSVAPVGKGEAPEQFSRTDSASIELALGRAAVGQQKVLENSGTTWVFQPRERYMETYTNGFLLVECEVQHPAGQVLGVVSSRYGITEGQKEQGNASGASHLSLPTAQWSRWAIRQTGVKTTTAVLRFALRFPNLLTAGGHGKGFAKRRHWVAPSLESRR